MMMKRISLLVFLCFFTQLAGAQTLQRNYSPDAHKPQDANRFSTRYQLEKAYSGQGAKGAQSSNKTSSISVDEIGGASNPYTIISNAVNQVVAIDNADDSKDVVAWIHRQNNAEYGGTPPTTANGINRIDFISPENSGYCKQGKWSIDVGPFNPIPFPNTCRPRYPQALLYTPPGATSFNDTRCIWVSPCTDGNNWGNYNWGMAWNLCNFGKDASGRNLPNTAIGDLPAWNTFLGNQQDNNVLIPSGLCNGKPGEVWFVDNSYRPAGTGGNNQDSILLFKGTVREKDVQWKKHTALRLGRNLQFYNSAKQNNPEIGECNMEFSPDGKWGWVVSSAIVLDVPGNPRAQKQFDFKPVFWWSDNSGESWNGPIVVNLRNYTQVIDSIQTRFLEEDGDTAISTGIPFLLGAPELTVDKNGNPHVLWNIGNGATTVQKGVLDSLGYFNAFMSMYDITTEDRGRTWCPKFIHRTVKSSGTVQGTDLNFGNYTQIARDVAGERIFYSWLDDSTRSTSNSAMLPNLHTRALRITDNAMTDVVVNSRGDAQYQDKVFFPTISPTVLQKTGGVYQIPTVFVDAGDGGIVSAEGTVSRFLYINNRTVNESDFKKRTSDVELVITAPAEKICFGGEVPVSVRITNVGSVPVKDSVVVTYMVNGKDMVREVVRLAQPLAPNANITYTFTKQAVIRQSGSYALDVMSTTKDDEICANHVKQSRVLNYGGEARRIFADNVPTTGCGSLMLNTGLVGYPHKWFINGKEDTTKGPILNITQTGNSTIRVEVTNPDCANEPLTATLDVTVNDIPPITVKTNISVCAKDAPNGEALRINAGGADFQYRWLRRTGPTTPPVQVATTNDYTARQNADLIAWVKNTKTGCVDSQDVKVRIWDIKANLTFPTTCGRQAIEASNETTGDPTEGTTYEWYVKNDAGTWDTLQKRSRNSAFRTLSNFEMKEVCYRVSIWPPQEIIDNAKDPACKQPVSAEVCGVTSDDLADPEDPNNTTNLAALPNCSHDLGSIEDPIRKTINPVRTSEESNMDILKERTVHFEGDYDRGATKVTSTLWTFDSRTGEGTGSQTPRFGRVFRNVDGKPVPITDLSRNNTELVNLPCISLYVRSNTAVRNVFVRYEVYSGTCRKAYTYATDAVLGTPTAVRDAPEIRCAPVSRNDLAVNYDVSVYPNPTNGSFTVNAGLPSVSNLDVTVYDVNGRLVYSQKWTGSDKYNQTIDISNLSSGVYILKLAGDEGYVSQRIVKE